MNIGKVAQQIVVAVIGGIIASEVRSFINPTEGPKKKKAAAEVIMEALKPVLPDPFEPVVAVVVAALIDAFVAYFNHAGFFGGSVSDSSELSPTS